MKLIGLVLMGWTTALVAGSARAQEISLKNPGFETAGEKGLPANWGGRPDVYSRDTTVARTGGASLKFVNPNQDYVLCSQRIPLEAGQMYEVSGWVRTQGVKGSDSGATICVEWSAEDGKYLGGVYPRGKKGDTDWTLIKGLTRRIPAKAKRCSVTCYVRKGMTGTAWWDDIRVCRVREDPLSTVLAMPNYRHELAGSGPKSAIRIWLELNLLDYDLRRADVSIDWSIVAERDGAEIARGVMDRLMQDRTQLKIPARDWPMGRHRIEVKLIRKGTGKVLAKKTHWGVRRPDGPARTATIDEHHRLILNGKPFFPLGMYWSTINKDEIEIYAKSAFNCLMPYRSPTVEQMDLAHRHGLKVIYSVKDIYHSTKYAPKNIKSEADERAFIEKKVKTFAGHPALMAWYINDELPLDLLPRLSAHRQWLEELDPNHPTWVVLYQVDHVRRYLETFDVIGTDPYPIPTRPPSMAGEWTRKTFRAVGCGRPVWQVPQVFNWACYKKGAAADKRHRPPTLDEMRSMAWQCITEGAKGLVFYSWFDIRRDKAYPFDAHWPKVKTMAAEIKDMIPVLLSVQSIPTIRVPDVPAWLHWMIRQVGDKTYVIAVNDGGEPGTARFTLPGRPTTIAVNGQPEPVAVDDENHVVAQFRPLEVRIYEIGGLRR